MADRALARRYAQAFIELADEADAIDRFGADLRAALHAFQAHDARLFDVLSNPVFTKAERRDVLDAVLPRLDLHPLTRNLLKVLLENGRFGALPEVKSVFDELADVRAGRVRVRVDTAEPLSPQLEAEVRASFERITGKTVLLETRVEPALIGGLVARVGGKVYDASVKSRLQDIKSRLLAAREAAEA